MERMWRKRSMPVSRIASDLERSAPPLLVTTRTSKGTHVDTLTMADIQAAQTNDLEAVGVVAEAMERRIAIMAHKAARQITATPDASLADEFRQVARIAMWDLIPKFAGSDTNEFFSFMTTAIRRVLADAIRSERYPMTGVDRDSIRAFAHAYAECRDAGKAQQMVTAASNRISADRAYAARIAWAGYKYIDEDVPSAKGIRWIDTLPATPDEPELPAQPAVGRGLVITAAKSLASTVPAPKNPEDAQVLVHALESLADGYATPWAHGTLERLITVPRDRATRRIVLGALGVIRTAAYPADETTVGADLLEPADLAAARRERIETTVRTVLSRMGRVGGGVLTHTFGIGAAQRFETDAELAEALKTTRNTVWSQRTKAQTSFAKRFVKQIAEIDPGYASILGGEA